MQSAFAWLTTHWPLILPFLLVASSLVSTLITALTNHPAVETWLHRIQTALSWLEHADVGGWKWPLVAARRPTIGQDLTPPRPRGFITWPFWALILLLALPARAQVISVGASLPLLEFQPNQTHPVSFAPGVGVEGSLGFFQLAILGEQYDMLDFTAQVFASAPGSMQVALLIGTLNGLVGIGAALPLYGNAPGVFQGSFNVFPVFSFNIPIDIGPMAPPTTTEDGPRGLRRGATLYLPSL